MADDVGALEPERVEDVEHVADQPRRRVRLDGCGAHAGRVAALVERDEPRQPCAASAGRIRRQVWRDCGKPCSSTTG